MKPADKPFKQLAFQFIEKNRLIRQGDHILAAVSGGPDSVCLLSVLIDLKDALGLSRLTVAHFDHRLRGAESDQDLEFVRSLAHCAGLDFVFDRADVSAFARKEKLSIEMAARERRRSFFFKTAAELGADKIALGHTADDQAEEVLLRILRGTGPTGIQAMSAATGERIIRPLLFATRASILKYLGENGREFRNDSSNFVASCQRNFLRLKVFPLLREAFNPQIALTITRCAELAREEESWWKPQIEKLWDELCLEQSSGGCALDLERLAGLHPALLRRVLRFSISMVKGNLSGVGLVHLQSLMGLVLSGKRGKSVEIPGEIQATVLGAKILISSPASRCRELPKEPLLIEAAGTFVFAGRRFELGFADAHGSLPDRGADSALMDVQKLRWPLQLRVRRPGDRFHPLGMKGGKKLKDFFIDCKIPRQERQGVPLLCDSEKICWVAGMRLDQRVKVDSNTRQILIAKLIGS
ncbi:MAG: tRNA lysidine(34) synthetase TilS [Syntrophobacteraceae bacterium]